MEINVARNQMREAIATACDDRDYDPDADEWLTEWISKRAKKIKHRKGDRAMSELVERIREDETASFIEEQLGESDVITMASLEALEERLASGTWLCDP